MSFEIKKIYTENPYVDEMVYYTKLMGLGTVLKMKQEADNAETVESLKNAGIYISCMEGTITFDTIPYLTKTCLESIGITDPIKLAAYSNNKYAVNFDPEDKNKKKEMTEAFAKEFIENYEETNTYYRMLHGLPAIGQEDYVEDWLPPDGVDIDLSKPIHEMTPAEINILDHYGVLDDIIAESPTTRQYIRHLHSKSIDYYTARKANRFDILFIPEIDSDSIYKMYKDKLDANKNYVLRTVYSEAYNYDSDYYDNFIAILIVILTIIDVISRVQEFIARKEIFDIRSVQYIFKSNGVPFYEDIPLKYQISMVKNIHTLIKYKSTKRCMIDICQLFGFSNVKIFKYFLLKERKTDANGNYVYAFDEDGNEDQTKEYTLSFLKLPLEEDVDKYVSSASNYVEYDNITNSDPTWDGGLDHDYIRDEILKQDFNIARTKYISIDSIYDIARLSAQQSYFFNFLYNRIDKANLTIEVPLIETGKKFGIADIFCFLTALGYYYNDAKDLIMDTQSKVLFVNGFNFKADLQKLAEDITDRQALDTLNRFITLDDDATIPSVSEMMNIFINNMDIRDTLIKGMEEAESVEIYTIYKNLYDALMISELTNEYFRNPDTGELYRDSEGDATYTEFLKYRDNSLYAILLELENFSDKASRNQYIANLIDNITYALEEYINPTRFTGIYSNIPAVSTEVVNQYISSVIGFYKSHKVDFLGVNNIYKFDDKIDGRIYTNDCMHMSTYNQREDRISIRDYTGGVTVSSTKSDNVDITDRIWIEFTTE